MSVEDIYMKYDLLQDNSTKDIFTKEAKTRMGKQKNELKEKCQKYIEKMIKIRTDLVENVFSNKNDNQVRLPVSFINIIGFS
jgi:hypothetical protein